MFQTLPATFKKHKLPADVRTLLIVRKAMDKQLVRTLGDLYYLLRGLITSTPTDFGPFAAAFYDYFLGVDIKPGEKLENAIIRSAAFQEWKTSYFEEAADLEDKSDLDLVDQYLDEIHTTTYDIQKVLSGKDILKKDDPDLADSVTDGEAENTESTLQQAADYRDIPLEELLERMRQVAEQQRGKHTGGSHWIGSGGISPYGNNGAAIGGIRVGGSGGGKMARKVVNSRQFYPVDTKSILKDDNVDAALAALKGIYDETTDTELDIPKTITEGVREGGLFLPYEKEKFNQKVEVILIIDNGGYSMTGYIKSVTKLFSKMKTRFAHDLKTYYYHNTIYGGVYSDVSRRNFISVDKLLEHPKSYSVFVIGDADMAPYELDRSSVMNWMALEEHFPKMTWLNPLKETFWHSSMTVMALQQILPMYYLSPEGIQNAVLDMNRKGRRK
ncbi:MAG: hypothetical protein ACI8YQ_000430 [Polaribacter sp.]|jgi:uncharacterized protein with von Willebrand factor type A (vWA) domain